MKRFAGALIGLGTAFIVIVLSFLAIPTLGDLELKLLDARFLLRRTAPISGDVVVLAVDTQSIDKVGRWPWPRETTARLLRNMCEAGVSVAAFDIVFSEPQREPAHDAALRLSRIPGLPDSARRSIDEILNAPTGDEALASAIADCADRVVLGYYFQPAEELGTTSGADQRFHREAVLRLASVKNPNFSVPVSPSIENNIDLLTSAATHYGFFNMESDRDGQLRHYQLIRQLQGEEGFYPALAVQAIAVHWGDEPPSMLRVDDLGEVTLKVAGREVYADEEARQLLDFRGKGRTFPHVSAVDVLERPEEVDLKGKVAFIGVTEIGIKDIRPTPLDPWFPGTEVHATVADGMIRGQYLRRTLNSMIVDMVSILVIGLVLGHLLQRMRRTHHGILLAVGVVLAYCVANYLAFALIPLWVNAIYPLLTIGGTYTGVTLYRAFSVERRAREIRNVFQKYVASSVVEEMLSDPTHVRLGGEKRTLTILFSDIRGFTSISEKMDPQMIVGFLNSYFTPMTEIIFRNRGTLDKYMGDAIMAFWGAPLPVEDHAFQCCKTALEMRRKLAELRGSAPEWNMPAVDIGIGINTGPVAVGNMGSEQIYDYTVIGDAANLASRLEGANKTYGTSILMSEATWEALGRKGFLVRHIDRVRVKGKAEPVEIFELRGEEGEDTGDQEILAKFHEGLQAYYERRFQEAHDAFEEVLRLDPQDTPARLYLGRCVAFGLTPPPEDWDGVFVMETK